MSRYRIFQIDDCDPVEVGKKSRLLYAIYASMPIVLFSIINLSTILEFFNGPILILVLLSAITAYFLLLRRVRKTIIKAKPIGEFEITKSIFKKRLGDTLTEYDFRQIKKIHLIKHLPSTRILEGKGKYFSYILKIKFHNNLEENLVISDRSIDLNHKISVAESMKTFKKIAPFEVTLEL